MSLLCSKSGLEEGKTELKMSLTSSAMQLGSNESSVVKERCGGGRNRAQNEFEKKCAEVHKSSRKTACRACTQIY